MSGWASESEHESEKERESQREGERPLAPRGARLELKEYLAHKKSHPPVTLSRTIPRVLGGSKGGRFLMSEVPLYEEVLQVLLFPTKIEHRVTQNQFRCASS